VRFRYTDDYRAEHPSIPDIDYYNVIAQEFREVFPNSVKDSGEDGILQVDTYPATIHSIAAIKELHQIVLEKDAKISELEARLAALERLVAKLAGK
jgi:tryptophan synthase alpha subunit